MSRQWTAAAAVLSVTGAKAEVRLTETTAEDEKSDDREYERSEWRRTWNGTRSEWEEQQDEAAAGETWRSWAKAVEETAQEVEDESSKVWNTVATVLGNVTEQVAEALTLIATLSAVASAIWAMPRGEEAQYRRQTEGWEPLPDDVWVGAWVKKGEHLGQIVAKERTTLTVEVMYRVHYRDGQVEHLFPAEVRQ